MQLQRTQPLPSGLAPYSWISAAYLDELPTKTGQESVPYNVSPVNTLNRYYVGVCVFNSE